MLVFEKKKPRVLITQAQTIEFFVNGGKPIGGSAMQTFIWMMSLNELGFEVFQVQTSDDRRELKSEFSWLKIVKTYDQRIRRRGYFYWYRIPSLFFSFCFHRIDFLYSAIPTWEVYYFGVLARCLGIRHIIRISSDNITSRREGVNPWEITKIIESFKQCSVILVQNKGQFESIKKVSPLSRVHLIYNPIVIDRRFFRVKVKIDGFIAWVANFRDVKNMALLCEIAKNLQGESFRIAGEPLMPLESETEVALEKLKKMPNVEFVGRVERESILEFFRGAKYLLNTSKFEGFSNTFLEAMITGTPILTTSKVNPDGIIDSFGLGILYADASDLADKLSSMHEGEYAQLSANCLKYVAERHDHLNLGKELKTLLLEGSKD